MEVVDGEGRGGGEGRGEEKDGGFSVVWWTTERVTLRGDW